MKNSLITLCLLVLCTSYCFAQSGTITGEKIVCPNKNYTYKFSLSSNATSQTPVSIYANSGIINDLSSTLILYIDKGKKEVSFNIKWDDGGNQERVIEVECGGWNKLTGIKIVTLKNVEVPSMQASPYNNNNSYIEIPFGETGTLTLNAGNTYYKGFYNDNNYKISKFKWESGNTSVEQGNTFQLAYTKDNLQNHKITITPIGDKCQKVYGSPASIIITRKIDAKLVRKTENTICIGENIAYEIEGYTVGANFEWSTNNSLTISSGQGTSKATFKGKQWGEGLVQVKITIGSMTTTLTNSDAWIGSPKTPSIDGFSTMRQEFNPNSLYFFDVKSPHYSAQNYSWKVEGGTIVMNSGQWIQVKTDNFSESNPNKKQHFAVVLNATNKCGTTGIAMTGYVVFGVSVITRSGNTTVENINTNTIKSLKIYSLNGSIVYSSEKHTNLHDLDINNIGLKSGIYILETKEENNTINRIKIAVK